MPRILIVYASTEGQTRKVARFCTARLAEAGHAVELLPAADAEDTDPTEYDGAILAASVHLGHYQAELQGYARSHAGALNRIPTLFLSVSLSAAGDDPGDWQGLRDIVAAFEADTGWTPGDVVHVAGAFRFVQYNWLKSWAMRYVAAQRGQEVSGTEDREYTDWTALGATLDGWTAGVRQRD